MTALSPRDRHLAELAVRLASEVAAHERGPATVARLGAVTEAMEALLAGRGPRDGYLRMAGDALWELSGTVGRAEDADRLALAHAAVAAIGGDVRAMALLRSEGFEVPGEVG